MTIKVKCQKCGETGKRKDQEELAKSNKCKVCGGTLEMMKGSVMDVPLESLVKTGVDMVSGMVKKQQEDSRKKVVSSFESMQTTLDAILEELRRHSNILEAWKEQDKNYHDETLKKIFKESS